MIDKIIADPLSRSPVETMALALLTLRVDTHSVTPEEALQLGGTLSSVIDLVRLNILSLDHNSLRPDQKIKDAYLSASHQLPLIDNSDITVILKQIIYSV